MKNRKYIFLLIGISFCAIFFHETTYVLSQKEYTATKAEVQSFIDTMAPMAQEEMKESGIYASLIIAQAALESGWGTAARYHNYFGMKGYRGSCSLSGEKHQGEGNGVWGGTSICLNASEGGLAYFRAYNSIQESLKDHDRLFWCSERYAGIIAATTLEGQLRALATSGYRTGYKTFDDYYYNSILRIINQYDLTQYDKGISYDGGIPDYASSCSTTGGTPFTGEVTEDFTYTSDYSYFNLETSYTGDITKGYIYQKYSPLDVWNELTVNDNGEKTSYIIGRIFKQGERLYGDNTLHLEDPVPGGSPTPPPVEGGVITSGIPLQCLTRVSSEFNSAESFRKSKHKGLDIAAPAKVPIYTVTDGTVTAVFSGCSAVGYYGNRCGGGYGNYVKVQASDGTVYIYAHMYTKPNVSKGDKVIAGQQIGVVGSSGSSTGNHLHFEVKVNGTSVNPMPYANVDMIPKC